MPAAQSGEGRAFQAPSRYIQGPGELKNLPKFAGTFGNKALLIIDTFFFKDFSVSLPKYFEEAGMQAFVYEHKTGATDAAIEALIEFTKTLPEVPDSFIGIGGGTAIDVTKAAGAAFKKAWFSCPTAITTDAPTSTHSVVHNPGEQPKLLFHYKNPDFVVVDTDVTINAPAWMMASGIGDALATYIESLASYEHNNVPNAGCTLGNYKPALTGMAVAKLCYDVLMTKGRDAMIAAKNHLRTPAYEDVVEATVLLSGLGFECTGVSIAHGLEAGFHVMPVKLLHGTGVGYCTLIQLLVENKTEMFKEVYDFCKDLGMPVSTYDLGLTEENRAASIEALVDDVYAKRWNVMNVPHFYSRDTLVSAIYYLDAYTAQK